MMGTRSWFRIVKALTIGAVTIPWIAQPSEKPTQSRHKQGPNGLEGWTLNYTLPDYPGQQFPMTLVIARNGRILWRIEGDAFIWKWMFWEDGRQVIYESGPLHFGLSCVQFDLKKGHEISRFDCYQELPENAPAWAEALEAAPN
jgi:hypothetical protein